MKLGKASAYAVFACVHIAENEQKGPIPGRDIAESCGIPVEYLLKILQQLVRSEVLRSERGPRGGFVLYKPASQTSLLDIVEAIEGTLRSDLAGSEQVSGLMQAKNRIGSVCDQIAEYTRSLLRQSTIDQMVGMPRTDLVNSF